MRPSGEPDLSFRTWHFEVDAADDHVTPATLSLGDRRRPSAPESDELTIIRKAWIRDKDTARAAKRTDQSDSNRCCLSNSSKALISGSRLPAMIWSRLKFF